MEKFTCRLCLKVAEGGGLYKHVNEDTMKMLNNCFPDVNLSLEHEMLLCSRCIVVLEVSCNFKKCVMQTERKIFSKCHNSSLFKVSMKTLLTDVQLRRYEHEKLNEFNICRLCLQINNYKCNVYLFESPSSKLLYNSVVEAYQHVLELDLSVSEKPVMCDNCWNTLKVVSAFRKRCLNTEQKFRAYCLENNLASLKNSDFYHIAKKYPNNEMQKLVLNNLSFEEFEQIVRKHGIDGLPEEKTIRTNINKNDLINLNNVKVEQNDDLELPNLQYALNNATQNATFKAHRETEEQDLEIEVPCDDQKNKIEVMEPKVLLPPGANLDIVEDNSENEIVDDVEIKCEVDEDSLEESVIKVESVNDKIFRNLIVDLSGSRINNIQVDNKSPSKRKVVLQKLVIDLSSSTMDMDLFTNLKNLGFLTSSYSEIMANHKDIINRSQGKVPPDLNMTSSVINQEQTTPEASKSMETITKVETNENCTCSLYNCDKCFDQTKNKQCTQTKNESNRFICNTCLYQTTSKIGLFQHMKHQHVRDDNTVINQEQTTTPDASKLKETVTKVETNEDCTCSLNSCDKCFDQTKNKQCIKTKSMFTCNNCSYQTKYRFGLFQHMKHHHVSGDATVYQCDKCSFSTVVKNKFLEHCRRDLKCILCGLGTNCQLFLNLHIKEVHTNMGKNE